MQPSSVNNPFVTLMIIIMALLALIIFMMGRLVISAAGLYFAKWKKAKEEEKKSDTPKIAATLVLLLLSARVFAQGEASSASTNSGSLSKTGYYLLSTVVGVELLIVVVLLYMLRVFTGIEKKSKVTAAFTPVAANSTLTWWDKFNSLKPLTQEADIQLDHNYDGIKELDNRLPPWWLYGFYLTIVFAGVYLYMHEVSHSAPSGVEEYQIAVAKATVEKDAYLKKAANNVDENTVKLLTDETSLASGKQVFQSNCFACHGKMGEGGVGPNLTDDYWLHGNDIADVFKTIKYGWADKGMKSWKDDFSPVQIAQLASYVKSLHGSNPPNAKPPQGTLVK